MTCRIVVGVDGSAEAEAALVWARDQAARWDARVVAIQAWEFTPLVVATDAPVDLGELRDATEESLRRQVETVFGPDADKVECRVVEELPARAILEAAEDADLVVVGSRGMGGVKGFFLGSVSAKVTHHAPCPVVVVPAQQPSRTTGRRPER